MSVNRHLGKDFITKFQMCGLNKKPKVSIVKQVNKQKFNQPTKASRSLRIPDTVLLQNGNTELFEAEKMGEIIQIHKETNLLLAILCLGELNQIQLEKEEERQVHKCRLPKPHLQVLSQKATNTFLFQRDRDM